MTKYFYMRNKGCKPQHNGNHGGEGSSDDGADETSLTPQDIQDAVDAYLAANPITSDVSTLTDNNDGTFTHTANGVAVVIDTGAALGLLPAATLNTLVTNAITNNPDAIITALAAATNLVPIGDLAGTTTHQGLPA